MSGVFSALSLTAAMSGACNTGESETPKAPSAPSAPSVRLRSVSAAVECLNSAAFELVVGGHSVHLSVHYPDEEVYVVGRSTSGQIEKDQFDSVYLECGVEIERGTPVAGLKERFERAFPGHPVASAVSINGNTLHVRTEDRYAFYVMSDGLNVDATVDAFLGVLTSGQSLADAYFPAVRMRQKINGELRDARRFGMEAFFYYVAPVDVVILDLTVFPLHVTYYADHVELAEATPQEVAQLEVSLAVGFNEVPVGLRGIDGVVLDPGAPRQWSFEYGQFAPFNADIDVVIKRRGSQGGPLPQAQIRGDVDLFTMFGPPTACTPGSWLFHKVTRRSPLLDHILRLHGETFPASDVRFPEWAEEDYYRRFPDRRP